MRTSSVSRRHVSLLRCPRRCCTPRLRTSSASVALRLRWARAGCCKSGRRTMFEQLIHAPCVTHTAFKSTPLQTAQPALPAYGAGYCSCCIHNLLDCLRYCCNPVVPETAAKLQRSKSRDTVQRRHKGVNRRAVAQSQMLLARNAWMPKQRNCSREQA